ncbi:MAG: hypothetical protein PHD13_02235 [Methanocellales archaeon]|nr:hypothetical protein [Methanocellales archaeon]MDD3291092.1 hypothetical protein [Methanocellales archaeon]MDD5234977.1 hypothetical protein [Methanocellales archaeon]MDD5484652.1 hypothetical protein [Methanocellales archaeon]
MIKNVTQEEIYDLEVRPNVNIGVYTNLSSDGVIRRPPFMK